ncbi:acyl-coenzyme A thioesterase 13 [Phoenix dactylifera]|uniref:Acyl-coenzyme A thioesterase 13 n=1 Tax=Phoenix dactylifera TaxID=42345 RepID=A0A8B7CHX1_PHODC|nr:acyl-coenzyme A thioesterase 13 [Phoenix dactylifera]
MAEEQQKSSYVANTERFFRRLGLFQESFPEACEKKDFYSDLIRSLLKVDRIESGRITCSLSVNSAVTNTYNTLHGGVVAAVAEAVALACVRTVAGDKEFFLGEFSTSYLSAARLDEEVEVDGCMLRQGRSVVVTSVEFKRKKTGKLYYASRATFYVMPVASL